MMCVMERQFTLASIARDLQGVDNGNTALTAPLTEPNTPDGPNYCTGEPLCNTWNNTGNSSCMGNWYMPPIVKDYCTSD